MHAPQPAPRVVLILLPTMNRDAAMQTPLAERDAV